jgi:hypothetical protein
MTASEILGSVHVQSAYLFDGDHWLEVPVKDWDDVKALPHGLTYGMREYGFTGWNSDRGLAYFSTRQCFARIT